MDPQQRLQNEVEKVINAIDKSHLRPTRKEAYLCSAKCCDANSSTEQLQHCITSCQGKVERAEQVMSKELEGFQQRLQRCAMMCSDNVQRKVPTDPSKQTPELIASLEAEAAVCANKCVDQNLGDLKSIAERIKYSLNQN